MTARISIPSLRRQAEQIRDKRGRRNRTLSSSAPQLEAECVLALVEAVEAARQCLVETEDEDGERWVSLNPGGQLALHDALARFDFGDDQ